MQLLRNICFWHNMLPLCLGLLGAAATCTAQINNGALHVGSGTTWVSSPQTAVVLDNMDLQYDASPPWLLNNTFRFTGTTNSAIGGNSQPYIYAISVGKTSPAKLYLTTQINIAKRINFQTGLFDLNSQYIALDETALLTNENETSRIYGSLAGGVSIFLPLNGAVKANPGNLGLQLTSPTSLGNVTISRGHVPMYIDFTSYSVARYYDVSPAANLDSNTTLRFNYFDAELNGLPEDSLGLWEANDGAYFPLGFTTRNVTLKYVEKHGPAQPGRFTLYTYDTTATAPPPIDSTAPPPIDSTAPPPADTANVHVVIFGSWINGWASLSWVVSPPNVTDHLVVERKYSNESSFTAIKSILAISTGTTTATGVSYNFTDSTVRTAPYDVSYRINAVGTGGSSTYSNTVTLAATSSEGFIIKLYPTIAVGGQIYIKAGNMAVDKMQLQVFDSRGGLVMSGTLPYVSQWLSVAPLARGVYRLSLRSASNKFIGTFIK